MAKVYVSGIINLPVDRVWALARDFNGHAAWHPLIAESHIEEGLPSDRVGCVRNFKLSDGGHLRERLLSFSDLDRSFTYNIIVSPLPIRNYLATFDVAEADEPRLLEQVGRNTFAAGIAALAKALGAPS